jgi:hypothetical protein
MTIQETTDMLVKLGMKPDIAGQIVQRACNAGRYSALVLNGQKPYWRTYTVHHGMRGNITHYCTIEIS